jgi:ubiquinone/menaquinone biosynthesis C-methylase UbiE
MDREKIKHFYAHEIEKNRLELEEFKLEGLRTKEIITRYLTKSRLEILDVGGGAGFYAFWLQELGHSVSLVDLSPKNIELAQRHSEESGISLKKIELGDATNLNYSDDQFDIVMLLGPLYHLVERAERISALSEAKRVLKPGGVLISAVISRYASLIDGFLRDLVFDDNFFHLLKNDLRTGIHLNDTNNLNYFTTAYFHTPDEIQAEILETGLKFEKHIAVESFGWAVRNFKEKETDKSYMTKLLEIIQSVETDKNLIAISPHIIAIARSE